MGTGQHTCLCSWREFHSLSKGMRKDGRVGSTIPKHTCAARWLNDIIDAFVERRGTAHVRDIARDLAKSDDARDKDTVEQIVTRRINDFRSDAADFSKDAAHAESRGVRAPQNSVLYARKRRGQASED
jgi:hypothetical protein